MQAYSEVLRPTSVTSAVALPFLTLASSNLIVAKHSLLQVFEVPSQDKQVQTQSQNVASRGVTQRNNKSKLLLVDEFPLSGVITSLAGVKIQNSKSGGHALLVAVRDAKFSLIEWDPEVCAISTTSIHYYESEELRGSPWSPDLSGYSSFLTVDPSNRCVGFKFGQRHLAVLPIHGSEDEDLDDYDEDLDGPRPGPRKASDSEAAATKTKTPYGASFVLQLTALDPAVLDPVDLAFLHEYREPTLGILYASRSPSSSLLAERKDTLVFGAFTLDIKQRARTPLLSIPNLPSDLFKLIALPLPVGGTLLVGGNELVHVDQSGKILALAVNEYAREQSSLSMTDQSNLHMKLDHCALHVMPSRPTEVLIILSNGQIAVVNFKMDGRNISSMSMVAVPEENGGQCIGSGSTCTANLGKDLIFLGSADGDSSLISCSSIVNHLSRKRSHAEMTGLTDQDESEEEDEEDEEDEDDLYGEAPASTKKNKDSSTSQIFDLKFAVSDTLENLTTVNQPVLASRKRVRLSGDQSKSMNDLDCTQLVLATGYGNSGGLAFMNSQIDFDVGDSVDLTGTRATWALSTEGNAYHNLIISTHTSDTGIVSTISALQDSKLQRLDGTDFETDTETLLAGVLAHGKRVVQVCPSQVKTYDPKVKLSEIRDMFDEDSETDLKIHDASLCDPFLLAIRDDGSAIVLKMDEKGELEELERDGAFASTKWVAGSLYSLRIAGETEPAASIFMLSEKGGLHVSKS